jgi:hypothetical protein
VLLIELDDALHSQPVMPHAVAREDVRIVPQARADQLVSVALLHFAVGAALLFAGVGSMAAAAVVLLVSAPDKVRSALIQGAFPAIAIVCWF